ncbi:MAG TPA: response regulator [Polyangiales bacterium]
MSPKPGALTILLVEDDVAHAEITRRNLVEFRERVRELVHVQDGQAALDYLFSGPRARPDLVLLDLRLPRVDGFEVMRRIKGCPELRHVPVVVLTTSSAERDMRKAYEGGASSYLVKPVDFQQFVAMMRAFAAFWLMHNRFPNA